MRNTNLVSATRIPAELLSVTTCLANGLPVTYYLNVTFRRGVRAREYDVMVNVEGRTFDWNDTVNALTPGEIVARPVHATGYTYSSSTPWETFNALVERVRDDATQNHNDMGGMPLSASDWYVCQDTLMTLLANF